MKSMAGIIRGSISPKMMKELMAIKKDIRMKFPNINIHKITLPKLQEIWMAQRAFNFRNVSREKIMEILIGR